MAGSYHYYHHPPPSPPPSSTLTSLVVAFEQQSLAGKSGSITERYVRQAADGVGLDGHVIVGYFAINRLVVGQTPKTPKLLGIFY